MMSSGAALVLALALAPASAINNGKGITPPMGWRSWNLFGGEVNQTLMTNIMAGMVDRSRTVDGVPTSLCDLGYCDVGLDDAWQECGAYGADEFTYHAEDGTPQVNFERFPDLMAMTDYAHSLGLTAGWYGNNCICKDHCGSNRYHSEEEEWLKCYEKDVTTLFESGFDGIKLDGCGKQKDLDLWADLINATGKAITIENCHWGQTVPHVAYKDQVPDNGDIWCPWNFYRSSTDVRARFANIVFNLETTVPFARHGLSFPGCWAYPDMLEVGCAHGPGGDHDPGLTAEETRAHFGAWCIVSSPLTLSHDVTNGTISDAIWPVIANPEAIAVNQAWAGHSGSPFLRSGQTVSLGGLAPKDKAIPASPENEGAHVTAAWQHFYKPLELDGDGAAAKVDSKARVNVVCLCMLPGRYDASHWSISTLCLCSSLPPSQLMPPPAPPSLSRAQVAVLMMNQGTEAMELSFDFAQVPGLKPCGVSGCAYAVRDVWAREDLGAYQGSYQATVASHDAAFVVVSL